MSEFVFKNAVREAVPLLLGLIGQSGSGKTYSAFRIATGIVGNGNRFAVIDTESRRALHYADKFAFDHCEIGPPFTPQKYADAIRAADQAGYKAIVVDSVSHEWAGEGGVIEWHDAELDRMVANAMKKNPNSSEYQLREAMSMAAWVKPKTAHKQMVQRLLQVHSHLILCFRAEDKVKMEKDDKGKTQIVPIGIQPVCSKEMPYELMASFLMSADRPGYPHPLKLQEQHKAMFPPNALLDEKSGGLIAEWARGGATLTTNNMITITGKQLYTDIFAAWRSSDATAEENKAAAYKAINDYAAQAGIEKKIANAKDLESLTAEECDQIKTAWDAATNKAA